MFSTRLAEFFKLKLLFDLSRAKNKSNDLILYLRQNLKVFLLSLVLEVKKLDSYQKSELQE